MINGNLVSYENPENEQTKYEYDGRGFLSKQTAPNGAVTTYQYNDSGEQVAVTDALGNVTHYEYDAYGNVIAETSPAGVTTRYHYDEMNRLISTEEGNGAKTTYGYSEAACDCSTHNLSTSVTNALGAVTKYEYDQLGQVTKVIDPLGNETKYEYDDNRRLVAQIDALGRKRSYNYDAENQLIAITRPDGEKEEFTYNVLGIMDSLTDAKGHTTRLEYDAAGRLIAEIDPEGAKTQYAYNKANQLVEHALADETLIHYQYDRAGRLTWRAAKEERHQFRYNDMGQIIFGQNEDAVLTRSYDLNGRLIQEVIEIAEGPRHEVGYSYEKDRVVSMSSKPYSVSYGYDVNGALNLIQGMQDRVEFGHDELGRRAELRIDGQLAKGYTYNQNDQLTKIEQQFGNRSLFSEDLKFNPVGNITAIQSLDGLSEFSYDDLDQLIETKRSQGQETFAYDVAGNPRYIQSAKAKYNKVNAFLSAGNSLSISYDPLGRPLIRKTPQRELQLSWDSLSQLTKVNVNGQDEIKYLYDPLGRRIGKVFNDRKIYYGYDYEDIIAVYDEAGNLRASFLHGPGIDEPLIAYENGEKIYYVTNYLGSVEKLINAGGEAKGSAKYSSFGERDAEFEGIKFASLYSYTGREYDPETGLYYFRNRYYDSTAKKFVARDPIGFHDHLNLYQYVSNNPARFYDPFGLLRIDPQTAKKYPNLDEYFRSRIPEIKNNKKVISAMATTAAAVTEGTVLNALTFGQGPTIEVRVGTINPQTGAKDCAWFQPGTNFIIIESDVAKKYEGCGGVQAGTQAIGVSILHEVVHWLDDRDGTDQPGEEGEEFEKRAYGKIIPCKSY